MTDDDLPVFDVRTVAVVWADDDGPTVEWSGCSIYEAVGLLHAALLVLEHEMSAAIDEEIDDADDD